MGLKDGRWTHKLIFLNVTRTRKKGKTELEERDDFIHFLKNKNYQRVTIYRQKGNRLVETFALLGPRGLVL